MKKFPGSAKRFLSKIAPVVRRQGTSVRIVPKYDYTARDLREAYLRLEKAKCAKSLRLKNGILDDAEK